MKCGEERPVCQRCSSLRLHCEWGVPVKRGRSVQVRDLQPAPQPPSQQEEISLDFGNLALLWERSAASASASPGQPTSLPAALPFLPPFSYPTPIYPSVTTPEVACANSLVLSKQDQKYFQYFPSSSLVFYYMKAWQWSSFCYLYQGPAATSKVIMRMILALSASDMHRNGLDVRSPGRPTAEDHARYHYGLAVKEFRQTLETPRRHISHGELEMIFVTMFLMVMYECQFGHHVRHLQLHLQGVRSLLETHPELFQNRNVDNVFSLMDTELPDPTTQDISFVPIQMLLWMLYVDISAQPMGATESLYDYVLQSGNAALQPDHLYQGARLWGRCFWGEQYPEQEVMDDNENYRGLELIHVGMVLRHVIWRLAMGNPVVPGTTFESLFQEMMAIRNVSPPSFHASICTDLTRHRDTLISSSQPKWPAAIPPTARSTQSSWPSPTSTPKSYSTAAYCASIRHRPHSNGKR